jgi:cysteine desulfurase/selenocysteine lyase
MTNKEKKLIRLQFPLLVNNDLAGTPCAYLDSAATTQKPQQVIDAVSNFYTNSNANVHRGLYGLAEAATAHYEASRAAVARFIGARSESEVVFTKNTTEAINLVAHSWGRNNLIAGDVILLSQVEHHANMLPWLELAKEKQLVIRYIPYSKPDKKLITTNLDLTGVKLLAVMHTSNLLGNVWDHDFINLHQLIADVKAQGGTIFIDAAQSIAHMKMNVQDLGADFMAFSGHKMYGPTGIGVLYANSATHNKLNPYQVGGSMIYAASYTGATWAAMPQLLEAGTPPISSAIGLHAAIDFMNNLDYAALHIHETALCQQFVHSLQALPGIHIVTHHTTNTHQHLVSFYHETVHAHDIASFLGEKNVAVRAGHHCAQPLVDFMQTPALVRLSVAAYTTQDDIKAASKALEQALNHLT